MPFAAAVSEHPLATQATGEVVGAILERLGPGPDLAMLFVTAPHAGAIDDIAATVRATLGPTTLLGVTAVSVVCGAREIEEASAVALWAGRLASPPTPVRLTVESADGGMRLDGLPADAAGRAATLILLADPFTFPVDGVLDALGAELPDLVVIGGLASAARGPGGNRLVLDRSVTTTGAVGVLLDPDVTVETVVSQGCRPIGQPFTVTRAEGNVVYELGGRPALERLMGMVDQLSPEDRSLAARGLHAGLAIDERKLEPERGDFLVRNVLGADRAAGAVAVGDIVGIGQTLQFQARDAVSADEDLRALMAGRHAQGALVFTCNGRGTHLFGVPDHDAGVVVDQLATAAVAGMFCAGEVGPIGGRNFLHGFTASVALFRD